MKYCFMHVYTKLDGIAKHDGFHWTEYQDGMKGISG